MHASRRHFLQTAAAGAVLGPYSLSVPGRAAAQPTAAAFPNFARGEVVRTEGELVGGDRFRERAREIPVAGRSDILVVGAGPAGIGAALAAARAGAKVQWIEAAGLAWAASLEQGVMPHEIKWKEGRPAVS